MKKTLFFATTALASVNFAAPALAQVDEIVVTATKREQTLQEVPIAVSVVQAETVADAQIVDALDLQSLVPALRVSQLERSSNTTFIIRGQGNGANNPGIEPSVAVYIDGVFRPRAGSALNDLVNLERVEVLRGPQSTLFGKNATAGVVSVMTKKPEFEWSGIGEFTVGNYNQRIAKGYITGPINDFVAFSLSSSVNKRDGTFDNNGTGGDFNDRDRWAIQGQLLAQPTDNLELRLIADYDEIDERCCGTLLAINGPSSAAVAALGGQTSAEGFEYEIATDKPNENQIQNYGFSFHADWDFIPNATLTSITSYRHYDDFVDYEGDFTTLEILGENIRGLEGDTFTQELRLQGSAFEDRVNYLVGAFYFNEELDIEDARLYGEDTRAYVDLLTPPGTLASLEGALGFPVGETFYQPGGGTAFNTEQSDRQFQLFTQMDFNLTDKLVFTGGVAYFQADKEIDFRDVTRTNPFSDLNLVQIGGGLIQQGIVDAALAADPSIAGNPTALQGLIDTAGAQAAALAPTDANPLLGLFTNGLQPLGALTPFPNSVEDGETTDTDFPYTLRLAYDATARSNVYVSYSRGFKASSWNLTPDTRPNVADIPALRASGELAADNALGLPTVVNTAEALGLAGSQRFARPEITKTWEIGMKTRFSWGQFNIALFDQTVEDFQTSLFQGTGFAVVNAGEQSAQGVEFDTTIAPPMIPGLTFNISGLYIDAEYDSFVGAPVVNGGDRDLSDGVADGRADISGDPVAGIPEFSGSFGFDYRRDFAMGEAFLRADYQYESNVRVLDNIPASVEREVGTLNASVGVNLENGVEALLWARNLNNDEYYSSAFPTTLQSGSFS
ncbi:MAG: TonB-dependent receptor, partial [Pseudomonadota bacterium]